MLAHRWTSTTAMDQMDIDHVKRVEAGAVLATRDSHVIRVRTGQLNLTKNCQSESQGNGLAKDGAELFS
jgi:hypothetical protein